MHAHWKKMLSPPLAYVLLLLASLGCSTLLPVVAISEQSAVASASTAAASASAAATDNTNTADRTTSTSNTTTTPPTTTTTTGNINSINIAINEEYSLNATTTPNGNVSKNADQPIESATTTPTASPARTEPPSSTTRTSRPSRQPTTSAAAVVTTKAPSIKTDNVIDKPISQSAAAAKSSSSSSRTPNFPPLYGATSISDAPLNVPADAAEELPVAVPLIAAPPEPSASNGGGGGGGGVGGGGGGGAQRLPEFPQRSDAVYFVVAVTGGAKIWSRTLARTLIDMGEPFGSPQGPPLRPLYVDIPANGRFAVRVLTSLCQQAEGQPLAGVVVIGDGHSARAVAMAGSSMGLPVLWAKGGTANLDGMHREIPTPLQVMLQPSAKEILESVRALFLQTHWHSFFVLSDVGASMVMAGAEGGPLTEPPLVPKILPLSANSNDVFRQLAQISRSTRGVVLLLCDLEAARRIMAEAQNLNMVGGHFIWIWADTSSTTEFFDAYGGDGGGLSGKSIESRRNREHNVGSLLETNAGVKSGGGSLFEDRGQQQRAGQQHPAAGTRRQQQVQQRQQRPGTSGAVRSRDRSQPPADRYIIGLNSEADDRSEEFGPMLRRNQEAVQLVRQLDKRASSEESAEHLFISNLNSDDAVQRLAGIGEDSDGEDGDAIAGKPKRKTLPFVQTAAFVDSRSNASAPDTGRHQDQHVLFHHFKDFPVGFLALRPIRMNIDRHFIRAAVRLFASTWAKVELEERDEAVRSMHGAKVKLRQWGDQRQWKLGATGSAPGRRRRRRAAADTATSQSVNIGESGLSDGSSISSNNQLNRSQTSGLNGTQQALNSAHINTKLPASRSDGTAGSLNSDNLDADDYDGYAADDNRNADDDDDDEADGDDDVVDVDVDEDAAEAAKLLINDSAADYAAEEAEAEAGQAGRASGTPKASGAVSKRHDTWWSLETGWPRPNIDIRYMRGAPHYQGGCYGRPEDEDRLNANYFARMLKENCQLAMSGQRTTSGYTEKSLTTHFELLNLVPDNTHRSSKSFYNQRQFDGVHGPVAQGGHGGHASAPDADVQLQQPATKWRRVGLVSGRNVHLDTIVWPGGDIVVSGLSARARSVFRVVTALAPPFVMESDLDEDGLCLRGLPCHRLAPTGRHNLTLMFNAIETRDRLEEDAVEHGNEMPPDAEHTDEKVAHITKCCYGLSMDILDNVATELGFEFHLYIVRDELFGAKHQASMPMSSSAPPSTSSKDWSQSSGGSSGGGGGGGGVGGVSGDTGGSSSRKNYDHKSQQPYGQQPQQNQNQYQQQQQQQQQHFGHQQQKHPPTARMPRDDARHQWNGIMGDLVNGLADMSFAPLSVSKSRAEVIDFTAPYFHSGVSLLAAPATKSEIPLLAFLLPFSPELWIAIFTSLNITAVAVAVYEWLSPFGLNPWGRQRSKNFSMSSALWVMWGLLCGHLVAFKAPKSWPNKFLINVWGGFSVIFVASYTANIAALIAGLFFHNAANMHDTSLFRQRVGVPKSSAAESYVQQKEPHLWEHMRQYRLETIEDGIQLLKNNTLDLLMADAPVLEYYRATDHGCQLQRIGDLYVDDSYAIGMKKGFPLRDSISALIAKYASNGYLDILTEKWYGGLPCFKFEADIVQPRPLGVEAVAGVFLLLFMGMLLGVIILCFEHWFYKFALPRLRVQANDTVWKSRNIMFFSQKLYRFINCVELVSPHHAARELVHSIRQGQIASLFQKSIKRKEDEQRRRRKSKAQFFEMIQEARRVNQIERAENASKLAVVAEDFDDPETGGTNCKSPPRHLLHPDAAASGTNTLISTNSGSKPRSSPRGSKLFAGLLRPSEQRSRSNSSALSIRRFSTDSIFGERMDTIGRRLSRDISYSPPDLGSRRFETFGKAAAAGAGCTLTLPSMDGGGGGGSVGGGVDTFGAGSKSNENITTGHRYEHELGIDGHRTLGASSASTLKLPEMPTLPLKHKAKHQKTKRPALNFEPYQREKQHQQQQQQSAAAGLLLVPPTEGGILRSAGGSRSGSSESRFDLPAQVRPSLEPPIYQVDRSKATLRARMHRELREKYAQAPLQVANAGGGVDDRPPVMPAAYCANAERLARYQLLDTHHQATVRPPVPSPRNSKRSAEGAVGGGGGSGGSQHATAPVHQHQQRTPQPASRSAAAAATAAAVAAAANSAPPPRPPKMSFERLSREDLLRLSHSSQSEIHEYLNGSGPQTRGQPEPP